VLIQAIRKVSLINSVYTYTNNFTFTASFDQPTTDFNTKSSNLHVVVSQMRAVVLVHDKIQANCKEIWQDIATCHAVSPNIRRFWCEDSLFLFSLENRLKMLYKRCLSFETSSELNSETRSRSYKNICYVLWVMPLINSVRRVLVKSTTACMYRSNEILGASGDFGE